MLPHQSGQLHQCNDKDYLAIRLAHGKFLSYTEVIELAIGLTFSDKLEVSHKIIDESLRIAKTLFRHPVISVSFSGGKSSLVVLDMVLQHVPRDELYVVYCNTLNEYPENREYVFKVVKDHFRVKKLVEVIPRLSPWRIWKIFGFPKIGRNRYYTPVCCILLKELPMKVVIERYNINLDFTGIQATEAFHRMRSIADNGLIRRTKYVGRDVILKKAILRVMPIGLWLDSDIWEYLRLRQIPVNPIYEKYKIGRQGCLACTNTSIWREMIKKYNENLYKFVESKLSEWGIQEKRIRFNELISILARELHVDTIDFNTLYIIKEHFD